MMLLAALLTAMTAWGEAVTEEQAQEIALAFLKKHHAATAGTRRAPATPQLTTAGQVSGLYLFNVNDNGGFVIVSNDDRTIPILGYSDSGNIDIEKMPDNMRAWLQGYADEIAWLMSANRTRSQSTRSTTPRRDPIATKTAIAPLLTTTWSQGSPYNAAIASNFVTGCVATAMAQAMYYTETKAGNATTTTTAEIPAYQTYTYGLSIDAVAANTVINWKDMINDYSGNYNATQYSAVAWLMYYCGCSVKMDYGPSSSARVADVPYALKTYFGYNSTTQYVSRSYYSYANWTDIIYHELSQGRPVVYGGQAVDNGHAFVCDGYKYDDGDLFHINWGWGGQSDGYFVLSVLNPDQQGIGGSASNSAYNSGQDAVIGIQKTGGTGSVSSLVSSAKTNVSLTINSITPSLSSIALGESVSVTLNVTNNSKDANNNSVAYDGEISLVTNNVLGVGKMFEIAAGATQDCVINFTPSAVGSYTITAAFPTSIGDYQGPTDLSASLEVVNQTPVALTATGLTTTTATIGWTNVGGATKWNLRYQPLSSKTEDFSGDINDWRIQTWSEKGFGAIMSNGGIDGSKCFVSPSYYNNEDLQPDVALITPEIVLANPFSFYAWGKDEHFVLLLSTDGNSFSQITDVYTTTETPKLYSFDLSSLSGTGWIGINHCNSSGHTSQSFLYIDNVTYAVLTDNWTIENNVTSNSYQLDGLSGETTYAVQAQAVNNDGGNWSDILTFTTQAAAPTDLVAISANESVILYWTKAANETAWNLRYRERDATPTAYNLNGDFSLSDLNDGWHADNWQTFDGDHDGINWTVSTSDGRDGSKCFVSDNTNSTKEEPANCLYTPQFTLGGSVTFYMKGDEEEFYMYIVDENGKYINIVKEGTKATSDWMKYTVNLGAYIGTGRVVFVHDSDGVLLLDDVTIYKPGAWTTVSVAGTSLAELTLVNTTYCAQVQAVFGSGATSDWSEILTFNSTILELASNDSEAATKNKDLIAAWDGITATVKLMGRTLYKDGEWNTFCVPFDMTAEQVAAFLNPAALKELDTKTGTYTNDTGFDNGTLYLNFKDATSITAGKPYLIKWTKETNNDLVAPLFANVTVVSGVPADITSADGSVTFRGTYSYEEYENENKSILFLGEGSKLYYPDGGNDPTTIGALRAYFELGNGIMAGTPNGSGIRSFALNFGDEQTGITTTNYTNYTNTDGTYTIDGRKIVNSKSVNRKLHKGIYIRNGKKIVIK